MPAINFPTNPSTNDTYTLGNKTWKFNGSAWDLQPLTAGYTGSQGNIGYTGSQGDTGFTGSKGDTGYTGSQGYTGSTGAGYTGSQGDTGYTGSIGYTGSSGYTGSKGTLQFTQNTSAPGSPNVGDIWVDSYTGKQYSYYNDGDSSQWVELGSVGAVGFTGSSGYTGSAGTNGFTGSTGYTGSFPSTIDAATTSTATSGPGYMGLPQNSQSSAYTLVIGDAGKHIYVTTTATITIPANGSVAYPIGTVINLIAGSGVTITVAITTDTLYLGGTGTTGSRTVAAFGMATLVKLTSTTWIIGGTGVT